MKIEEVKKVKPKKLVIKLKETSRMLIMKAKLSKSKLNQSL